MNKKITYSAPGKVILSGEHGVVYGKPALVTAIQLRTSVTVSDQKIDKKSENQVSRAFQKIHTVVCEQLSKNQLFAHHKPPFYHIQSTIPIGRGLGSSAALCAAAVAALYEYYIAIKPTQEQVNQLAYQCEKLFHGNPSGVDNSAASFGGLIYFRKEFEFLKNLSALNFKLPTQFQNRLFLIDTGKPSESTTEMVEIVGKGYNQNTSVFEQTFWHMEKLTKRLVLSIVTEDQSLFMQTLSENMTILKTIGVVSAYAANLAEQLSQFGCGKITGAGGNKKGSGFLLFFAEQPEQLKVWLQKKAISYLTLQQDFVGVQKL